MRDHTSRFLSTPSIIELEPAGEGLAWKEVEGEGSAVVEQPGALTRHIGDHRDPVLVDQVESGERAPEVRATSDDDVPVSLSAQLVGLLGEVTLGDRGV